MDSKGGDTGFEAALPSPTEVVGLLRLLIAADTFPRGGLYTGFYGLSAALRYELIWLRILQDNGISSQPPLDVALAWLVHRQYPISYANSLRRRCSKLLPHPPGDQAFAFCAATSPQWRVVAGDIPTWPPPPPGSEHDLIAATTTANWRPALATQLCESMSRFSWQLSSWLRPHFLDVGFLERARTRYARFLALHAAHPDAVMVPSADIALLWHTHMGLGNNYLEACDRLGCGRQQQQQPPGEQQQQQPQQPQPAVVVARQQQTPGPDQDLQNQAAQQGLGAKGSQQQQQQQQQPGKHIQIQIEVQARSNSDPIRAQQQARDAEQRQEDLQGLIVPPGGRSGKQGPQSGVQQGHEGVQPSPPQQQPQQALGGSGLGSCQPFRPKYLDMPLEGFQLREAYRQTARLYEDTYGEPYDGPDTAWLPPSSQHPLAAPWSPLSFALRAFEDTPQEAEVLQAALRAAKRITTSPRGTAGGAQGGGGGGGAAGAMTPASTVRRLTPARHSKLFSYASSASLGGLLPSAGSGSIGVSGGSGPPAPCRAGAHALFAAWLASQRATLFFQSQTCGGLCFRRSWSIRVATVERLVPPLVNLAFFQNLPDSSSHPFLAAVRLRSGLCQEPPAGRCGEEGEAEAAEDMEGAAGSEEEPSVEANLAEEAEPVQSPLPATEPAAIAAPDTDTDTEPRSGFGPRSKATIAAPDRGPNPDPSIGLGAMAGSGGATACMGGVEVVAAAVHSDADAEAAVRPGEDAADEAESVTVEEAGTAGGGGGGGGAGAEGEGRRWQEQEKSPNAGQTPPSDGVGERQPVAVAMTAIPTAAAAAAAAAASAAPGAVRIALSVPAAAPAARPPAPAATAPAATAPVAPAPAATAPAAPAPAAPAPAAPAPAATAPATPAQAPAAPTQAQAALVATASCLSLRVHAAGGKLPVNSIGATSFRSAAPFFRSTISYAPATDTGAIPTSAGGRGLSGDGLGPVVHLYGGRPLTPADAEAFLDDAAMCGLAALLEASAAAVTVKVEAGQGDPADSGGGSRCASVSGSASPADVTPPRGAVHLGPDGSLRSGSGGGGGGRCGRHGDAPLWGILGDPVYAKRARAYFQHVWSETGRRGVQQAQMQAPGPGPEQEQEPGRRQWRGRV